jgi:UDP-N-acetylglucosamine 2-epimerase
LKKLEKLDKLDDIDKKIDGVSSQIHKLNDFVLNAHDRTIAIVKMERILPLLAEMAAKEKKLPVIISSHLNDSKSLLSELDNFIKNYEEGDYETKLVEQLFIGFTGYKSLALETIELG